MQNTKPVHNATSVPQRGTSALVPNYLCQRHPSDEQYGNLEKLQQNNEGTNIKEAA